ncbi:MAG TPA: response regulator [Opitutaceae bacterium]|nr:response regulator [Opitutaceae bacterium]
MKPTRTVLVVDDDEATRTVLRDLVERAGPFAVEEAASGREAIAAARRHHPDLILLDLMMPDLTGYDVCTEVRSDAGLREIPIIVLSAAEHSNATVAALDAGADDFLRKPCDLAELRAKIATILRLNRYRTLGHERERLRWLLDRSVEPVVLVDARGGLVFANARAREVFGLPSGSGFDTATALGRHFRCEPAGAWDVLRTGSFQPGTSFALFQPENDYVAARWFDVELQAGKSGTRELLLKFTDRTGQVRRDLETWTFQHMVFHKIRTPLNGLGNVLDLVADSKGMKHDPEAASLLGIAQESARRLETSLLDILSYHEALFRQAKPPVPAGTGSLVELVRTVAHDIGLHSLMLSTEDAPGTTGHTLAVLRPVLMEVCENYLKFSTAATAGLTLDVHQLDGMLELRCFAPGPVPPPDVLAQLGRPYWQVQSQFTGEIPGMGLGLATARVLLRSHGGDLRFSAAEHSSGLVTTIVIPLPVACRPEAAVA